MRGSQLAERVTARRSPAESEWSAEFARDSRLTVFDVLYRDIAALGYVQPQTREYFDAQELSGGAESLATKHVTYLQGEYDPAYDHIVAARPNGQPVTYEAINRNGYLRSARRASRDSRFGFQEARDAIYSTNYNGSVKDMWRGTTDYDTVMFVSAFPVEELHAPDVLDELTYDTAAKKAFIYLFRKGTSGRLEGAALRVGNGLPDAFKLFLASHGHDEAELAPLKSHHLGQAIVRTTTAGQSLESLVHEKAALFDRALFTRTGKTHYFGNERETPEAYELFQQFPEVWEAYYTYHELLTRHFVGWPLQPELSTYLRQLYSVQADHVLSHDESVRLGLDLMNDKVRPASALACKKLMTYAHYATLDSMFQEFIATGKVTRLTGDRLQAYSDRASGDGGNAAAEGVSFRDCEVTYGAASMAAAVKLAASANISLEEAMRRLSSESGPTLVECPCCDKMVWIADICAKEVVCSNVQCEAKMVDGKLVYEGKVRAARRQADQQRAKKPEAPAARAIPMQRGAVVALQDGQLYRITREVGFGEVRDRLTNLRTGEQRAYDPALVKPGS